MEQKSTIRISVRELVEFILRSGDIVSGFSDSARLAEGIKGHQAVQKSRPEGYMSEVAVSHTVEGEYINLEIGGRIDGVSVNEGRIVIEEIKTTGVPLEYIDKEYNHLHWAQAKCYAFIFAVQHEVLEIEIHLTYYQMDTGEIKLFVESFCMEELKEFFDGITGEYLRWANIVQLWSTVRNESIKSVGFPFKDYRKGQREFAVAVYKTIKEEKTLFAQAPTGTGKTMAALFPAVKAMGEGFTSKIFYLTAKTVTRSIAENAFDKMRECGLKIKVITLTAKEKICPNGEMICDPKHCEYIRGYYDRIKKAVEDVYRHDRITRQVIVEYALMHKVCPFEFSLDISLWVDCIICDYNYVFDPGVYLKRFFMDKGGDYVFLIDEAHNLVDRAREMFSAELIKRELLDLKKALKHELPEVSKELNGINTFMIALRKSCVELEKNAVLRKEPPKELYSMLRKFADKAEEWLAKNQPADFRDALLELYFHVFNFLKIWEFYDERYVTYFEKQGDDVRLKLFCLDPSYLLRKAMERGRTAVLFSATLTPLSYFRNILGGNEDSYTMKLASPYCHENLCLMVADRVSTKYKNREYSYLSIAEYIQALTARKKGNYMIFFPSYKYMEEVFVRFTGICPEVDTIVQTNAMKEEEREEFLKRFQPDPDKTLVGFGVMGGIFSEGVDLQGERLIGAVIVGVGLPQVSFEQDIIMGYFNENNGLGYEYAYMYPGMNKVLQAAGRVIRSENDRGVVLLIDERFSHENYQDLFPEEWNHHVKIKNINQLETLTRLFWNNSVQKP